jgi:hypothetical protein
VIPLSKAVVDYLKTKKTRTVTDESEALIESLFIFSVFFSL